MQPLWNTRPRRVMSGVQEDTISLILVCICLLLYLYLCICTCVFVFVMTSEQEDCVGLIHISISIGLIHIHASTLLVPYTVRLGAGEAQS